MTSCSSLLSAIATLYNQHNQLNLIPATRPFPFDQMYAGQLDALTQLDQPGDFALTSHTGTGKTAVFLAAIKGKSAVVIEPRKFLQKQCASYWEDYVLFGKLEYKCKYAKNAAVAPCNRRNVKTGKMTLGGYEIEELYPCEGCKYLEAVDAAHKILIDKKTLICNFGNFWRFIKAAEIIVIDEADLFIKEICSAIAIESEIPEYSKSYKYEDMYPHRLLKSEVNYLEEKLHDLNLTDDQIYTLTNRLYTLKFLEWRNDMRKEKPKKTYPSREESACISYIRKTRQKPKFYVELSPEHYSWLISKIFEKKRVIIVTATPTGFDNYQRISYSIPQRAGIFYCPVGKLTSRNLKVQPWLMNRAAEQITTISELMVQYEANRVVVHCGNIGNHATKLYDLLGHDICTLHEKGNIMRTIDSFLESENKYLLVASAEYGADFAWCKLQFVLKFPYAMLDERTRTLEKSMGKDKFNRWYTGDAINRVIQQCGRNVRGFDDFGVTIIQDSKFMEIYRQYPNAFPDWFKQRFDGKVY